MEWSEGKGALGVWCFSSLLLLYVMIGGEKDEKGLFLRMINGRIDTMT